MFKHLLHITPAKNLRDTGRSRALTGGRAWMVRMRLMASTGMLGCDLTVHSLEHCPVEDNWTAERTCGVIPQFEDWDLVHVAHYCIASLKP